MRFASSRRYKSLATISLQRGSSDEVSHCDGIARHAERGCGRRPAASVAATAGTRRRQSSDRQSSCWQGSDRQVSPADRHQRLTRKVSTAARRQVRGISLCVGGRRMLSGSAIISRDLTLRVALRCARGRCYLVALNRERKDVSGPFQCGRCRVQSHRALDLRVELLLSSLCAG